MVAQSRSQAGETCQPPPTHFPFECLTTIRVPDDHPSAGVPPGGPLSLGRAAVTRTGRCHSDHPRPATPLGTLRRAEACALVTAYWRGLELTQTGPKWRSSARPAWHDRRVAIIALLHGSNLNLLGQREPHVYGSATLADYEAATARVASAHGHTVEPFQTNHEGELVDAIHAARGHAGAIIINPGAFTHYAWSIHDALAAFAGPIIEVHISNPNSREPWRHTSIVAPVATGTITGLGIKGYELAVAAVADKLATLG